MIFSSGFLTLRVLPDCSPRDTWSPKAVLRRHVNGRVLWLARTNRRERENEAGGVPLRHRNHSP